MSRQLLSLSDVIEKARHVNNMAMVGRHLAAKAELDMLIRLLLEDASNGFIEDMQEKASLIRPLFSLVLANPR